MRAVACVLRGTRFLDGTVTQGAASPQDRWEPFVCPALRMQASDLRIRAAIHAGARRPTSLLTRPHRRPRHSAAPTLAARGHPDTRAAHATQRGSPCDPRSRLGQFFIGNRAAQNQLMHRRTQGRADPAVFKLWRYGDIQERSGERRSTPCLPRPILARPQAQSFHFGRPHERSLLSYPRVRAPLLSCDDDEG